MDEIDIRQTLQSLPISINGYFGDALQPGQWENTLAKLENLRNTGHIGEVMIPTKFAASEEQLRYLFTNFPRVWLWYAITGLNETDMFSLEDHKRTYNLACNFSDRVVCAIRPIIPNRNDSMQTLISILEMVKAGNRMLLYEGYRDPNIVGSKKYEPLHLFNEIADYCDKNGILAKNKCTCIISTVLSKNCIIHEPQPPRNLEILESLGYWFDFSTQGVFLKGASSGDNITRGDVAFSRILTGGNVEAENPIASELLSIQLEKLPRLACTSSWFSWAQQRSCIINCDYCFANYDSKVRVELDEFGCNPLNLVDYVLLNK